MARLFVLLFLAQVVLAACALVSCLSAEDGEPRVLARLTWVLVILLIPLIGPIAWFLAGRHAGRATAGGSWPFVRFPERRHQRPLAPDDDPDFLRSISREQARKKREASERRENNPRRNDDETETRRRGGDPPVEDTRPEG